jgi:imidazole glycerol-phosphate synthase subunit HisH
VIVIIDYGMGNVGSILNMLKKVGAVAKLSSQPDDLLQADRLILPGVGSFDAGMNNLKGMGCVDALNRRVLQDRIPILGICLGMQLFSKRSEEGIESGLGWLDAETIRFRFNTAEPQLKIPHMGWDNVRVCTPSPIFPESGQEQRFYFVHSYHVKCNEAGDVLTTTHYGCDFASSVCRGNILGMQFHPEKSHRFGLEAFRNFLSWVPDSK